MSEKKCPDCGGPVRSYHSPGITRLVCSEKCRGWHVIKTINHREVALEKEKMIEQAQQISDSGCDSVATEADCKGCVFEETQCSDFASDADSIKFAHGFLSGIAFEKGEL